MSNRKALLFVALMTVLGATALPAAARTDVNIDIGVAPPAPQVEVVPAPRRGYVWAPGYWRWEGRRHVWVQGHWIREHRGYVWVPEHWEQRGPYYHFVPGHWQPAR
ncbi:MAG TPA: YXWGXW repeat-containing protein [Burkholderiales bacterium]|nr:YXWGXW repeat-containing protein [Burkholderiales bacterium]